MRFMVLVKGDAKSEAGVLPDEKQLGEMAAFNEKMVQAGAMLAGDGLKATAHGARVRCAGSKVSVTDGPFTEAKEVLGGYWMIQVTSKEEAIQWASRCPASDNEVIQAFEQGHEPLAFAGHGVGLR